MPHNTAPLTPKQQRAQKAEKAKKLLKGANAFNEDSWDEDDHPWEWIYEKQTLVTGKEDESDEESADEGKDTARTPRKRKARNVSTYTEGRRIIGARMGTFECKIGDTVLLKSDSHEVWVGIICRFYDDEIEGEKRADFLCKSYSV